MTKLIILFVIFIPAVVFSQNVAINNNGSEPHQSALLDVSSNTQGALLPRLTTLERTSIIGPAIGLTVYDTDTNNYWIYRGDLNGGWAELMNSYDKHWNRVGTHIFNNNSGNVGIGTNTPAGKLTINGTNPSIYIMNEGLANSGIEAVGFDMKIGTANDNVSGNVILNTRGIDRLWLKENGRLGLGTSNPNSLFTMNGINPMMQLQNLNNNRGFIGVNVSHLIMGTNAANITGKLVFQTKELDRMTIDANGRIGLGTSSPSTALTINGTAPSIQMQHLDINKGYLQVDNEDLTLGTNAANLSGHLNFVTKDLTRMVVDPDGNVGIGTTDPSAKLEVKSSNVGQVLKLNGGNQAFMGIWENDAYRGYVGSYYGNIADVDIGSIAGAVHLVTGNSIDLTAKSGKIGIGTENPEQLLHVNNSSGTAFIKATSGASNADVGLDLVRDGGVRQWRIANSGDSGSTTAVGDLIFQTQNEDITSLTTNTFVFNHGYFYPFSDNSVTLGRSNKRWSVVYAGNGTINTSDAREKTNIQNINYGLADVMKLRPVSFDWKDNPQWGTKLGLIAQEVKDVVGEVVVQGNIDPTYDEAGNLLPNPDKYGIYYSDLIPVLIKATQEQQQMIEDMKKEIEELKKQIEK